MPNLPRSALGTITSNFHTAEARNAYAHHYRAIGISAVAAGAHFMHIMPKKPPVSDIPAVLRGPVDQD